MSPIFVRPVREQLEHDRLIRHLQTKYKRKLEVAINVGDEQVAPVKIGALTLFPDLVLTSGKKLAGLVEVLQGKAPQLGDLPDASYVAERYETLHAEHVDRVVRLVQAIATAQVAISTIAVNYRTTEERLTANAADIAKFFDGVSGALIGEQTDAR